MPKVNADTLKPTSRVRDTRMAALFEICVNASFIAKRNPKVASDSSNRAE